MKGIGPKTAADIVQRFGTDSFNVIEHQPEKLLEVKGITSEKLEEIKVGYAESTAIRDLMTVLSPFKLTPKTAMKIYEHFGPDGAALLRKSFYQLCQISGFGFKRVDAIVQKSGGDLHDPMQIQGALFYALEKSRTERGHLYMEAEKLLGETVTLLNEQIPQIDLRVKRDEAAQELVAAIKNNVVVSKKGNIYLPHVFNQERETARIIDSRDNGKTGNSAYDYIKTGVYLVLDHPEYYYDYNLWEFEWDKSQPWKLAGQSGVPMQRLLIAVPGESYEEPGVKLTVKKLEAGTIKPLSGVSFKVESVSDPSAFSVTHTTGADGTLTLTEADGLTAGQYQITEEAVPEGYVLSSWNSTSTKFSDWKTVFVTSRTAREESGTTDLSPVGRKWRVWHRKYAV